MATKTAATTPTFFVGQAVTLITFGAVATGLTLTKVAAVKFGGKRVHVEGSSTVFDVNGSPKDGRGHGYRCRLEPTTPEHIAAVERDALWVRVGKAIGAPWEKDDSIAKKRVAITPDTLRAVVTLLEADVNAHAAKVGRPL